MNEKTKTVVVDVDYEVTITARVPFADMAPATRDALQRLIDAARDKAAQLLASEATTGFPQPSTAFFDAVRKVREARIWAARETAESEAIVNLYKSIDELNRAFEEEFAA